MQNLTRFKISFSLVLISRTPDGYINISKVYAFDLQLILDMIGGRSPLFYEMSRQHAINIFINILSVLFSAEESVV